MAILNSLELEAGGFNAMRINRTSFPITPDGWGAAAQNLKTPNQQKDVSGVARTYRTHHPLLFKINMIRIAYTNDARPTDQTSGPTTFGGAFEYVINDNWNSTIPIKFTFNGADTVTLAPGSCIVSDPIFFDLDPAIGELYIRSYVSGVNYPLTGIHISFGRSGVIDGNHLTSPNDTTAFTNAGAVGVSPFLILGNAAGRKTIVVDGDSIVDNSGETIAPSVGGFVGRAFNASGHCYNRMGIGGQTLNSALGYLNGFRGLVAANGANYISEWGTNDNATGVSAAQTKANWIKLWGYAAARGQRVFQTTIIPRTTSTDSWATASNQTPATGEAARQDENAWLRAGAPIIAGAAVAPGTNGALLAGQVGHPLFSVIDTAATIEVNSSNSPSLTGGRWVTNGSANYPTTDGTHPSDAMAELMSGPVELANYTF